MSRSRAWPRRFSHRRRALIEIVRIRRLGSSSLVFSFIHSSIHPSTGGSHESADQLVPLPQGLTILREGVRIVGRPSSRAGRCHSRIEKARTRGCPLPRRGVLACDRIEGQEDHGLHHFRRSRRGSDRGHAGSDREFAGAGLAGRKNASDRIRRGALRENARGLIALEGGVFRRYRRFGSMIRIDVPPGLVSVPEKRFVGGDPTTRIH